MSIWTHEKIEDTKEFVVLKINDVMADEKEEIITVMELLKIYQPIIND